MKIFRILNKVLGAILLPLLFTPLIALAAISRLFNFIDLLYRGHIIQAFLSIIVSPFTALATGLLSFIYLVDQGWRTGLISLITTIPARTVHFFKKQLPFGSKKDESVNEFFVSSMSPTGLNGLVTPGIFGKLTLKLISLCAPMEVYLAYNAKTTSAHNDVSLYFTEKNLSILKQKYECNEREQSAKILMEINGYLDVELNKAKVKVKQVSRLSSSDDTRAGKLQSAQDELLAIQAAQRCLEYFAANKWTAIDLSGQFKCTSATVLNYIWLAINSECPNEQNRNVLKEKLTWTLFQIQRGFNIVNDSNGTDMPECPTGAIGLLVRVICDEQEKIPDSDYHAADPSPANLSLALKNTLDRPFTSSYEFMIRGLRIKYSKDPQSYKQEQKDNITKAWKTTFTPLLNTGVLQEDTLKAIIDAGVDAWEPPAEPNHEGAFSI